MALKARRPRHFDRNLIVIGAGAAGLVAALIAATVRARVTLIEKQQMGGECLNTGCVPSKTLLRSAKVAHLLRTSSTYGFKNISYQVDFNAVMQRVQDTIAALAPQDSVERFTRLGVECVQGTARLIDPWQVAVGERRLTAPHIIIATGSRPLIPSIPGLEDIPCLHSDNFWTIRTLPERLLVLGGGPIACELAQAMARLGSRVTLVEQAKTLLPNEDNDISAYIEDVFQEEGITVHRPCTALSFHREGPAFRLRCQGQDGQERDIAFDQLLLATGRRPNSQGFGLEALGVARRADGSIAVDAGLRSSVPSLLACGDVTGPFRFTHLASHQAWYASVNALFGALRRLRVDYSIIPWATFTDPEVATVGLNEQQAKKQGIRYQCTRLPMESVDRARMEGCTRGMIKVLTTPGRDRILGASIVAEHAAELITEYISAMKGRYGLNRILGTLHIYPGWADGNQRLAGQWKRAQAPQWAWKWLERYHRWRRREGLRG